MKAASLLLPSKWTCGSPKVLNKISSFMPILAHAGLYVLETTSPWTLVPIKCFCLKRMSHGSLVLLLRTRQSVQERAAYKHVSICKIRKYLCTVGCFPPHLTSVFSLACKISPASEAAACGNIPFKGPV